MRGGLILYQWANRRNVNEGVIVSRGAKILTFYLKKKSISLQNEEIYQKFKLFLLSMQTQDSKIKKLKMVYRKKIDFKSHDAGP